MGSKTITVRLTDELAYWLEKEAVRRGMSQGRIVREELEKARNLEFQLFLRLAGKVSRPADLSLRKGFSTERPPRLL